MHLELLCNLGGPAPDSAFCPPSNTTEYQQDLPVLKRWMMPEHDTSTEVRTLDVAGRCRGPAQEAHATGVQGPGTVLGLVGTTQGRGCKRSSRHCLELMSRCEGPPQSVLSSTSTTSARRSGEFTRLQFGQCRTCPSHQLDKTESTNKQTSSDKCRPPESPENTQDGTLVCAQPL